MKELSKLSTSTAGHPASPFLAFILSFHFSLFSLSFFAFTFYINTRDMISSRSELYYLIHCRNRSSISDKILYNSFSSFNRTTTNNSNYYENFFVISRLVLRVSHSISRGYPENTRRFGRYLAYVLNRMIGWPVAKRIRDLKEPDDLVSRCTFRSREPVHTSSFACLLIYLFIQDASNARRFMNTILDISRLWSRRFHGKLLTVGLPAS